MCKKELFYLVKSLIVAETEVGEEDLLNTKCKTREVVDARYLLVYFLHKYAGLDPMYIAKVLSMTPQGVRQILATYKTRLEVSGKFFEITSKRIRNKLETIPLPS